MTRADALSFAKGMFGDDGDVWRGDQRARYCFCIGVKVRRRSKRSCHIVGLWGHSWADAANCCVVEALRCAETGAGWCEVPF